MRQRTRADAREHWWEQTRWAIERALSSADPTAKRVAIDILTLQSTSDLAKKEDLLVIDAIQEPILDAYHQRSVNDIESEAGYVVQQEPEQAEGGASDAGER